jgi:hypothetical protein
MVFNHILIDNKGLDKTRKRKKEIQKTVFGLAWVSQCAFGATPAMESASLSLKLFNFLEGAPIKVAH